MIVIREMMLSDVEQISAMEEAYFSMPWSKQALSEAAAGDQTFYMVAEDAADGRIVGDRCKTFAGFYAGKRKKRHSFVYVRSAGVKYGCDPVV